MAGHSSTPGVAQQLSSRRYAFFALAGLAVLMAPLTPRSSRGDSAAHRGTRRAAHLGGLDPDRVSARAGGDDAGGGPPERHAGPQAGVPVLHRRLHRSARCSAAWRRRWVAHRLSGAASDRRRRADAVGGRHRQRPVWPAAGRRRLACSRASSRSAVSSGRTSAAIILHHWSWRDLFFVNVPLGLVVWSACTSCCATTSPPRKRVEHRLSGHGPVRGRDPGADVRHDRAGRRSVPDASPLLWALFVASAGCWCCSCATCGAPPTAGALRVAGPQPVPGRQPIQFLLWRGGVRVLRRSSPTTR